ncbi:MAG: hypothetical protein Q8P01_00650 [bacterium]|nr:hypothetical protein [bacterium]
MDALILGAVGVVMLWMLIRWMNGLHTERRLKKTVEFLRRSEQTMEAEELLRMCRLGYTEKNLPRLRALLKEGRVTYEEIKTTPEEVERLGRATVLTVLTEWESLPRLPSMSEFRRRGEILPIEPPYPEQLFRALVWAEGGHGYWDDPRFDEETGLVIFRQEESDDPLSSPGECAEFIKRYSAQTNWNLRRLNIPDDAMREWDVFHDKAIEKHIPQALLKELAGKEYRSGITIHWQGKQWIVAQIMFGCRVHEEDMPKVGCLISEDFRLLQLLLVDQMYVAD